MPKLPYAKDPEGDPSGAPGPAEAEPIRPPTFDEVVLGLERRITIADREIVLRPLVIGARKRLREEIAGVLSRAVTEHPEIDLNHPENSIPALWALLEGCLGRFLSELVGVDEEWLDAHLTLAQASEIIVALLEVNQLPVIRKNVLRALQLAKTADSI